MNISVSKIRLVPRDVSIIIELQNYFNPAINELSCSINTEHVQFQRKAASSEIKRDAIKWGKTDFSCPKPPPKECGGNADPPEPPEVI